MISSWAYEAVVKVNIVGVMGDAGNNRFAPKDDYTREQCIVTIIRLLTVILEDHPHLLEAFGLN